MKRTIIRGYEVLWTDTGVWVNSPKGHNVARISRFAREVHIDEFNHCGSCKLGRLVSADWEYFVADVAQFYKIILRPPMRPKFFVSVE